MTRFRVTLTTRGAVLAIVLGIGFLFMWTIRPILPPLVWALILAYILDPLVRRLCVFLRLPRVFVVVLVYALLVGALTWSILAMRPLLVREIQDLLAAIPRIADDLQDFVLGRTPVEMFGLTFDPTSLRSEVNRALRDSLAGAGRQAIPFVLRAISSLFYLALFLVASFYMLLDLPKVGPAIVNFVPRRWRLEVIPLLTEMENVLGRYIRGQIILIIVQTIANYVILSALQVRYALVLAIVTGFIEIFPVIGPWTAGAIAVSVSLTQPTPLFGGSSVTLALAVGLTFFIKRQIEGLLVIPNIVGKVMQLHPLIVLFVLTAGGYLAGILGVLIAVPVAAVVKLYMGRLHQKLIDEEHEHLAQQRASGRAGAGDGDDI